jgi:hypothetical protein
MVIRPTGVLVLSAPDAAADFLVEGLTLRNGKRTAGAGGGLLATVGSDGVVTLNNNQIENNTTVGYSYEYPGGGAFISATTATLTNNNITGNTGGRWQWWSHYLRIYRHAHQQQLYWQFG